MKKTLIMMFVAAVATNINAQLVVDSLGRIGIGTETPKSMLSIGAVGDEYKGITCHTNEKEIGLFLNNTSAGECIIYGTQIVAKNTLGGGCYGGAYTATGSSGSTNYETAIGLAGRAARSYTSIGLFGGKYIGSYTPVNYAGVYGSETGLSSYFSHSGSYAGYFNGKVRVTNGIYATVLSPSASLSPSGQSGTTILSDRGESVTDKLSQVQAVQFLRYDPTKETNTAKTNFDDIDIDNMSPEELDSIAETMGDIEPEPYLSPIQYGLDADQLKAVYPELVSEDDNGNVSINYVEMVPLLVQSIKELSAKVATLEGTSTKKAKAKAETTAIGDNVSDVDMVRMDQNKPNPFSESTVIALNIPEQTQKASIIIYDMSGKQVQNIAVSERGETNITVYASDLTAGMYIYTLLVDGKVSVTRRMIVSGV